MHHIVIGAGPAGVTACETLRDLDQSARITLIGDEPEPPYARMAIPYLLVEQIDETGTYLRRSEDFYDDHRIDVLRTPVVSVNPADKSISLGNADTLNYDRLLIATGSTPIQPPIPGVDLPGIHNCWNLADARAIAANATAGTRVVLIGAGFIGCIILESLNRRGVELTLVEREDRMVPRMMDEVAGGMLKRWCESKGITVLTNTGVTGIESDAAGLSVSLDNGDTITAGLIITATGVQPNTGFLHGTNVATDQGILVDNYLETSMADIFAAGDVAQGRDHPTGAFVVQAIQPTAVEHGRIAAANMVKARSVLHRGSLNMNVLDTHGLISASFGQWMGVEDGDCAALLDEDRYLYLNLQFRGDHLVGASSIGYTQHIGVLRGLIGSRAPLGAWKQRLLNNPTRLMEAYLGSAQGLA
jgi:NAD(P)H-nitrite reductase large subunit